MFESTGIEVPKPKPWAPPKPQGWGSMALSIVAIVVTVIVIGVLSWVLTVVGYALAVVIAAAVVVAALAAAVFFFGREHWPGMLAGAAFGVGVWFVLAAGWPDVTRISISAVAAIATCTVVEGLRGSTSRRSV